MSKSNKSTMKSLNPDTIEMPTDLSKEHDRMFSYILRLEADRKAKGPWEEVLKARVGYYSNFFEVSEAEITTIITSALTYQREWHCWFNRFNGLTTRVQYALCNYDVLNKQDLIDKIKDGRLSLVAISKWRNVGKVGIEEIYTWAGIEIPSSFYPPKSALASLKEENEALKLEIETLKKQL